MSVFDQRGQNVNNQQNVNYQYNSAGNINLEAVQNRTDLINELGKLKSEIAKARDANVIDAEIATDVEYQITKASQQANKPEANKKSILDYINNAKNLLKNVVEAGGIVTALVKIAELVQQIF